ncbi:hypothetical protein CHGG_02588 [Chaetomium globosum CBS 148.51]|uniref:Uncharacterized protein n=1 Tax=Chaetomium globosum (strain ATCC 6205 / CBS 148.51 / DSM 1962 / NBRC 6347 / NRRL 1970) TaxID=306901 RepID=Q2HB16_CHAGB|nr:uncharacterized protein CHGG_02588 [Chaetomium globosum CBS 148.51]EAQ90653.1 hypothetical protein CHGG_02588 [Chaetomium globosum CBS 148.51]
MSSPRTPHHSAHPSLDHSAASFVSYSPQERRQSKASSFNESSVDLGLSSGGGINEAGGGGLGNLADELAAFSDEEDYDGYEEGDYDEEAADDQGSEGGAPGISLDTAVDDAKKEEGIRDSGVDVESLSGSGKGHSSKGSLALPTPNGRGHRRKGSEYDGSEYGSESDLESPGMPSKLVEQMDEVESLARRGTERNGSSTDGTFKRVTDGLRDLGSQANVEGGATRMPRPSTSALQSLSSLHTLTADLVQTLNYLSDTLHMSRQTTTTATRRLRAARETVAELRRDEELREEGERWLDRGGWGERLQRRECALVCGDVVGGFEKVCDDWRERLVSRLQLEEAGQA